MTNGELQVNILWFEDSWHFSSNNLNIFIGIQHGTSDYQRIKEERMAASHCYWNVSKLLLFISVFGTNCFTPTYNCKHTRTHMQGQTQSTNWTAYFLIKHHPIVIADPWVSLVPALKQQLSFPLPHCSPKCFQWRRKQQSPEGYVHMKSPPPKKGFVFFALIWLAWEKHNMIILFFFFFFFLTNKLQ